MNASDVRLGIGNDIADFHLVTSAPATAVQVTVWTDANNGGQTALFFGNLFGISGVTQTASAVATMNPRDIAFVVDLSGSMNDDTQPSDTATINSNFASQGYPTIGTDLLNQVYADFGYDVTYPNEPSQYIGQTLPGVTKTSYESSTLSQISSTSGPLSSRAFKTPTTSTAAMARRRAPGRRIRWIMDVQIHQLMPAAKPTPNSADTGNYNYWKTYIDYYWDELGYRSYVQFMMYYGGRTGRPGGSLYSPLSQFSADCPWHAESTAGGTFSFPPREMPTHAAPGHHRRDPGGEELQPGDRRREPARLGFDHHFRRLLQWHGGPSAVDR